ncbi:MAG: DMT family transporter [Flavobacteriales bacterium]
MTTLNLKHKPTQWVILLFLAIIWGSSFILMKRGLVYFSSTEVAAFRISLASIVLSPIAIRNLKKIRGNSMYLLITGLFGNAIPAFLFAMAQTQIPSALSGILNSLTSLFTLTIGVLIFRMQTTVYQIIGVLLALVGAVGLIGVENITELNADASYALLVVLAAAMYGTAVNTIKSKLPHMRPTHITALSFFLTGPWCLLFLLFQTDFVNQLKANPQSWNGVMYLTILAIIGTALAVVLFNRLIKETTAVFASTVTYIIPIVALCWGLIDGESILATDILFMLVILGGIFLVNNQGVAQRLNKFFR